MSTPLEQALAKIAAHTSDEPTVWQAPLGRILRDRETEEDYLRHERERLVREQARIQRSLTIMADPMVQAYLRQGYPLRRPEQVLGERSGLVAYFLGHDRVSYAGPPTELFDDTRREHLARLMQDAPPYLWSEDILQTAHASPLPRHVIAHTVLPHDMWWTFVGKHKMVNETLREEAYHTTTFVFNERNCLNLLELWMVHNMDTEGRQPDGTFVQGSLEVHHTRMPFGATWPDDVEGAIIAQDLDLATRVTALEVIGGALQMLAFLASPFTDHDEETVPRPIRRQLQRERKPEPPKVRFVRLRRRPAPVNAGSSEHHGSREFSRQWLVRAHYRAQWYRSLQAHKVIWIESYIKGPADKPFIPPVYKVAR